MPPPAPSDPVFTALVDATRRWGFQPAGPTYTVGMTPATTLVGFVHPSAGRK